LDDLRVSQFGLDGAIRFHPKTERDAATIPSVFAVFVYQQLLEYLHWRNILTLYALGSPAPRSTALLC
jgi:hypothetical protein